MHYFFWRVYIEENNFFVALFVLSLCPFDISVGVGAFVIGLSQISSFFFQLNKTNTSDKDLNIKVIGINIHTSVYDKRNDFGFPIVNFPWLNGDVPRLPSYGIYILQVLRFARCCTRVFDFHSKNLQITSKLLTQGC